jgi:D-3-phosphoglycerate dehydrogenase
MVFGMLANNKSSGDKMLKALISTVPFSENDLAPIKLLEDAGIQYLINPIGRKLIEPELIELIRDCDFLIAGTESITSAVLANAPCLKLISRVGVGLDGVDLLAAQHRGIPVCYTPDAPAPAVIELTLGLIFSLLRHIHTANKDMHCGIWRRHYGRRISEVKIGIIGAGRIGGGVVQKLLALGATSILVNDADLDSKYLTLSNAKSATKEEIYRECDVISIHVPLSSSTKNMIGYAQLKVMKSNAILVNTARGGIINEHDLSMVLAEGHLAGVAIDVFEIEPYSGDLRLHDRCLLTSHMGSMSVDCRARMEIEAVEEVVRFAKKIPLLHPVPKEEYEIRKVV